MRGGKQGFVVVSLYKSLRQITSNLQCACWNQTIYIVTVAMCIALMCYQCRIQTQKVQASATNKRTFTAAYALLTRTSN